MISPGSASRSSTRARPAGCGGPAKWKVHIATYEVPGGGPAHREQITRELTAIYRPGCNTRQYDPAWKDEWIGEYQAPTTGPVSRRPPDQA